MDRENWSHSGGSRAVAVQEHSGPRSSKCVAMAGHGGLGPPCPMGSLSSCAATQLEGDRRGVDGGVYLKEISTTDRGGSERTMMGHVRTARNE